MGTRGFWQELRRRHVYRVAAAYAVVGWILIQAITQIFPVFHFPDWIEQAVVLVVLAGFPIALVLAWAFDATPAGIVETDATVEDVATVAGRRSRPTGVAVGAIGVVLAVIAGVAWWRLRVPRVDSSTTPSALAVEAHRRNALQRNPEAVMPGSAAVAAASGLHVAPTNAALVVAQPIPAKSIAVLPFENLSTDKGNAYFADGMQDLILTKLADIGDLKVISRTSTLQYGSHPENLKAIGQQLGVATILEGSVQKAGNQVLINVQLIDARKDSHIWAQSYQRTLDNIFGVEGEVAGKVADALKARLTTTESQAVARVLTGNPEAYTLYLKAQYERDQFLNGDGQPEHLQRADRDLKQAIALDAKFAAAYGGLAQTELAMYDGTVEDPDATLVAAEANARKALALEPDLVDGYVALGHLLLRQARYGQALDVLQTGARLVPGNADIAFLLGAIHVETGDWNHGLAEFNKALSLDPRTGGRYAAVASILTQLRRYDDARQTLERGLAISPDDQMLRTRMAFVLLLQGDLDDARAQLEPLPPGARGRPALMAYVWWLSRDYPKTLAAAQQIPQRNVWRDAGNRDSWIGTAYVGLGDLSRAQAAFGRARDEVIAARAQHPGLQGKLAGIEMWSGHKQASLKAISEALRVADKQAIRAANAPELYEVKAEILAHFGDAGGAIAILRELFETPGTGLLISPAELKLDPVWDPIRKDPRFQALLQKYADAAPVAVSDTPTKQE